MASDPSSWTTTSTSAWFIQNDLASAAVAGARTRRRTIRALVSLANSEIDGRSFYRLGTGLEELPGLESGHPGHDVGGYLLHLVVVGQDRVVVDLTGDGDPVLGIGKILLQALE